MRLTTGAIMLAVAIAQAQAAAVRFHVRPEASAIAVRTDKAGLLSAFGAGHRHGILAGQFTARVCADPRTFEGASITFVVPVSSLRIDTPEARHKAGLTASGPAAKDIPTIQQRMLSPANLDSASHPEIRFESSSVTRTANGLTVSGLLAIRGHRRGVTVPIRIESAGSDYRFTGAFEIKLSDYGITPESVGGVVKVADQVTVLLDFLARPSAELCRQSQD